MYMQKQKPVSEHGKIHVLLADQLESGLGPISPVNLHQEPVEHASASDSSESEFGS